MNQRLEILAAIRVDVLVSIFNFLENLFFTEVVQLIVRVDSIIDVGVKVRAHKFNCVITYSLE
jgi:hypothetical protein